MAVVYHVITDCETISFTSPQGRSSWLKQWGQESDIPCDSIISDEELERLKAWERKEAS